MDKLILTNAGFVTEYKPTKETLVKMHFSSEPSIQAILGECNAESEYDPSAIIVKIIKSEGVYYWAVRLGGYTNDTLLEYLPGEHSIAVSLAGIDIDGTFYPSEITDMRPAAPLGLCAINYRGLPKTTFEGEFYSAEIYEAGELVEKYIPASEGNLKDIKVIKYQTIPGIGGTSTFIEEISPIQSLKEITIEENGVITINPDEGYSSMEQVIATVNVEPELIDVTIDRAGKYTVSDFSDTAYGIKTVYISNDEIPPFSYEAPEQIELTGEEFDQEPIEHTFIDGVGTIKFATPMTTIKEFAFFGGSFTRVDLPSSLTTIEKGAFTDNADLSYISFLGYDEPAVAPDAFRHIAETGELHHIEEQELPTFPVPEGWVRISDGKAIYEVLKVTENGTYEASLDYEAIKRVVVDVQPELEEKTISTAADPVEVTTDKYGLSKVTVVPLLSSPVVEYTENGEYIIDPEENTTISSAKVIVDVNPPLQEVECNELTAVIEPEEGYYGINKVTVDVPVEAVEETITENGVYEYNPSEDAKALSSAVITVDVQPELQEKEVNELTAVVEADEPYYGLSKVTVDVPVEEKYQEIKINGHYDFVPTDAQALSKVSIDIDVPMGDDIYVSEKVLNAYTNGTYELELITPEGYDVAYMNKATVNIDVEPILEERLIQGSGTYLPADGFDGFSKVVVDINDSPVFLDKEVTFNTTGTHTIVPDFGTDGFSQVTVNVEIPGIVVVENGITHLIPIGSEYTTASGDKIKLSL